MNKINWKSKLSSRKFWCALIAVVVTVLTACNVNNLTIEQVTAIISGIGALIAYIIGESYVDGKRAAAPEVIELIESEAIIESEDEL